jgi:hypothetical protein
MPSAVVVKPKPFALALFEVRDEAAVDLDLVEMKR